MQTISPMRRPNGYRLEVNQGNHPYISGCVMTPHGIVAVYLQMGESRKDEWTSMNIVHKEQNIYRSIRKGYTKRGLVTLAARFAKEIANADT